MCVLMTFFSWNGAYPGGHAVYTQGPWRALVGSMWTDPVGDEVLGLNPVKAPEGRTRLEDDVRPNYLMLLFLPLLFGATALAFFFTLMPQLPVRVPPQFAYLVPWRMVAVAALALLVTGLLAIQALRGFGLENAIIGKARAHAKEATKLPDRPSDEQIKKAEISEGEDLGRYNVRVTCALRIEFACLILAIIGALLTFVMTRRTDRPAPRFEFVW
jgi:hypothetical protein